MLIEPPSPHLIQILLPVTVKNSPQGDWTAVVLMEAASEPLAGSVRQKAAMVSPGGQTHRGKYLDCMY